MEKVFRSSSVKELYKEVQKVLEENLSDYSFVVTNGSYSPDRMKISLEIRMKDEDGNVVVSDERNAQVDSLASSLGVHVSGHALGSVWKVRNQIYTVENINSKSYKYPFLLKRMDGKMSKASASFMKAGIQLIKPSESDFVKWFTMDPDSDAILESDAEICDNVQRYLETTYSKDESLDKFLDLVDTLNEMGIAKKCAKQSYKVFSKEGIEAAYIFLKSIYKKNKK